MENPWGDSLSARRTPLDSTTGGGRLRCSRERCDGEKRQSESGSDPVGRLGLHDAEASARITDGVEDHAACQQHESDDCRDPWRPRRLQAPNCQPGAHRALDRTGSHVERALRGTERAACEFQCADNAPSRAGEHVDHRRPSSAISRPVNTSSDRASFSIASSRSRTSPRRTTVNRPSLSIAAAVSAGSNDIARDSAPGS